MQDKCQVPGCDKNASRLAAKKEGGIIDVCSDCYYKIYKS